MSVEKESLPRTAIAALTAGPEGKASVVAEDFGETITAYDLWWKKLLVDQPYDANGPLADIHYHFNATDGDQPVRIVATKPGINFGSIPEESRGTVIQLSVYKSSDAHSIEPKAPELPQNASAITTLSYTRDTAAETSYMSIDHRQGGTILQLHSGPPFLYPHQGDAAVPLAAAQTTFRLLETASFVDLNAVPKGTVVCGGPSPDILRTRAGN